MRTLFICDVHIAPKLTAWLRNQGFEAVHALELGFDTADDTAIWAYACERKAIVVSRDKDFSYLAASKFGAHVIWVRLGNCTNAMLQAKFATSLPWLLKQFEAGARVVELR